MNELYTMTLEQVMAFLDALHIHHYTYTCFDEKNNAVPAVSIANGKFHVFFTADGDKWKVSSVTDY